MPATHLIRYAAARWFALALSFCLGALAFSLASCSSGSTTATPTPAGSGDAGVGYYGTMPEPAVAMPAITLTDTAGDPYNLKTKTVGYVTLLYTGYTHCPDVCPATMAEMAGVLKQLPPSVAPHVKVIFISVDPERDTTSVIRRWLDQFSPDLVGLRAPANTVQALEKALDMPLAYDEPTGNGDYGVTHSAVVYAFDEEGVAHLEYPQGFSIADYVHDVTSIVEHGFQPPPTGPASTG